MTKSEFHRANYFCDRIREITKSNYENMKSANKKQTYVKTTGDAWINPINYTLEEVFSFVVIPLKEIIR